MSNSTKSDAVNSRYINSIIYALGPSWQNRLFEAKWPQMTSDETKWLQVMLNQTLFSLFWSYLLDYKVKINLERNHMGQKDSLSSSSNELKWLETIWDKMTENYLKQFLSSLKTMKQYSKRLYVTKEGPPVIELAWLFI